MNELLWLIAGVAAIALVALLLLRRPRKSALPTGVSVRYTNHARERMAERGVTAQQIAAALARPDRHEADRVENSVRVERDYDGRTLKVWVAEPWPPASEAVVKSTAWHYHDTMRIPAARIGALIGRKGRTIDEIRRGTGARINVDDDGTVHITGDEHAAVQAAKRAIGKIVG